jgi:hypothetical protein
MRFARDFNNNILENDMKKIALLMSVLAMLAGCASKVAPENNANNVEATAAAHHDYKGENSLK